MPIRLKPQDKERVKIQPEFIQEVLLIREERLTDLLTLQQRLRKQIPAREGTYQGRQDKAQLYAVECALQMARERGKGLDIGRGGTDYDITRLRKLPYVKMMVHHRNDITWLIGETPQFTYRAISDPYYSGRSYGNFKNEQYNGIYEHGPYLICVRRQDMGTTAFSWHLIPKNHPKILNRHPHAYDTQIGYSEGGALKGYHNPLDGYQSTCWGRFNGVVQSLSEDRDVPGLFGALYQFAEILNLDSMMVNIWDCPGIKLVEKIHTRVTGKPRRQRIIRRTRR